MGHTSNDLLHLEHKASSSSSLESTLLVCKNGSESKLQKPNHPKGKPITTPLPSSQVLGKVKDFLGVISEANKKLELDAKDNSGKDYDIEVLTGNESEYIEMDLMLGIADLQTPEAVAAAKSSIAGFQPVVPLAGCSSGTESEDSSDYDDSDNDDDEDSDDDKNDNKNNNKACSVVKHKRSKSAHGDSSMEVPQKNGGSKKRPKIVELS